MHIQPGVVEGAKVALSFATAAGAFSMSVRMGLANLRSGVRAANFVARSAIASAAVFCFFQLLPHTPVGVSELHLILGSTLFLLLGAGPAAVGLSAGLLVQGLFFAPWDIPQYAMNVTTLLVPLWALCALEKRIVPAGTRYADLGFGQVMTMSLTYQAGVVGWVAFWTIYGQGVTAQSMLAIGSFGASYLLVVALETIIDLSVLGAVKTFVREGSTGLMQRRVLHAAV